MVCCRNSNIYCVILNAHFICLFALLTHNSDLLWSDPYEPEAAGTSLEESASGSKHDSKDTEMSGGFGYNETRQCSYVFGLVYLFIYFILFYFIYSI